MKWLILVMYSVYLCSDNIDTESIVLGDHLCDRLTNNVCVLHT